ncbi:hypothetical protein DPEC_G00224750 [Dallia pectoralis]|uniref:Uncharacterized protein n=1 Tax=Dallia pectoralis TaxID=75939 RepID=A0ACC2G0G3_DALPE|nr:hypothetical protein DPEC_G00224750 [Dallia pectoralis]
MEHPIRKPGSFLKLPLEVALHVMVSRSTACDQLASSWVSLTSQSTSSWSWSIQSESVDRSSSCLWRWPCM